MILPRWTITDPIGIPPSALPFSASPIAARRNSSAMRAILVDMPHRARGEFAHCRGEPRRLQIQLRPALRLSFESRLFDIGHIGSGELAHILDVMMFMTQRMEIVKKNQRLKRDHRLGLPRAALRVEAVRN